MSVRLNNQAFIGKLIIGTSLLVFILLCTFHNFILAADRIAARVNYPLHSPALAKGVLLIAGKELRDPNFEKTVVLITEFNDKGAAGLVINRRTKIPVSEALPELKQLIPILEHLYIGGPVAVNSIHLLVRSESSLANAIAVIDDIYLINTLDQFRQLVLDDIQPGDLKLFSGLAGWAPGQLESELIRGDWYLWHTDSETVFNSDPEYIWHDLIRIASAKWVKWESRDTGQPVNKPENML